MGLIRVNRFVRDQRRWLALAALTSVLAVAVAMHHIEVEGVQASESAAVCLAVLGLGAGAAAVALAVAPRFGPPLPGLLEPRRVPALPSAVPTGRARDGPSYLQVFLS